MELRSRPEGAQGQRPERKPQRAKRARWQGQGRAAQGFRFSLLAEDRLVPLLRWQQMQDDAELFAALRQVKEAGLSPADHVRLCGVADGAHWIWQGVQQLFPTAEEILDYSHCAEPIPTRAELQYGEQPERAFEGVAATRVRLCAGEGDRGSWGLHRLRPATLTAMAAMDTLSGSLQHNHPRINYRSQRKAGYPLGSGGIESAHKFIGHARRNRSGAWWYVATSTHMLALRCATDHGTFEQVFERYRQRVLEQSQQKNVKK